MLAPPHARASRVATNDNSTAQKANADQNLPDDDLRREDRSSTSPFSRTMIQSMMAIEVINANATNPGAANARVRRVYEASGVRSCANDQRLSSQDGHHAPKSERERSCGSPALAR